MEVFTEWVRLMADMYSAYEGPSWPVEGVDLNGQQ
jgi:hypothetical protein